LEGTIELENVKQCILGIMIRKEDESKDHDERISLSKLRITELKSKVVRLIVFLLSFILSQISETEGTLSRESFHFKEVLNEIFQKGLELDSLTTQAEMENATKLKLENDLSITNDTIRNSRASSLLLIDRLTENQKLLLEAENHLLQIRATTHDAEAGRIVFLSMASHSQSCLIKWNAQKG
jgi:hypothetical protein